MSKRRKGGRPPGAGRDRSRPARQRGRFVSRPFEGLVDEPEWIALRELVPAATAPLTLAPEFATAYPDRQVFLATLLPLAWPAVARSDGRVFVGLQRQHDSDDPNRDVAAALLAALATEPGQLVQPPVEPGDGPRLADVLVNQALDITLYERFDFWVEGGGDGDPQVAASLERANESAYPIIWMRAARAAYWCQVPGRAHLRWVLAAPEERALPALARLAAAGDLRLGGETKFAGMFRASGLLVPVWDLPRDLPADHWEEPLARLAERYAELVNSDEPLDDDARRARQGLVARQLTLR